MATDFIGFTIDGVHSSSLGLYRVSDGSRYNEELAPTSKDITVEVPGGDGTYYFGSYYTQRSFSISVAFDGLSEENFRQLRQITGSKKIQELTFDEAPYKTYKVKATGNSTLKYICFGDERVYKGEGTLSFTAFDPFGHCKKKYVEDYYDSGYYITTQTIEGEKKQIINKVKYSNLPSGVDNYVETKSNVNEWKGAAGLQSNTKGYDIFTGGSATVYNPGDVETDWVLKLEGIPTLLTIDGEDFLKFSSQSTTTTETTTETATSDAAEATTSDTTEETTGTSTSDTTPTYYYLDSKRNLFFSQKGTSAITLLNDKITNGYWKKIPISASSTGSTFKVTGATPVSIEYEYLYL